MIMMIDYDNRQLSLMGFIMVIIIYCHRVYNPSSMDNHHYNNRDFDNVQIFFSPILLEGDEELRFAVPQVGVVL
jgi:hypothetical protein